jgi:hypothetical protein
MSDVIVDTHVKKVDIYSIQKLSLRQYWHDFFYTEIEAILQKGGLIIDVGGGLRIDGSRGNSVDQRNFTRFKPLIDSPGVTYKISDYTDQYQPDLVEDIHNLSFKDNSVDAFFCIALLEHVYDPKKATEEIFRVLKPGGTAFLYAPFIYRYHAHKNDYYDYFRYSKDGWAYLLRDFSRVTLCPVRGLFESLLRFTPLHIFTPLNLLCRALDTSCYRMRQISVKQASGYHVVAVK